MPILRVVEFQKGQSRQTQKEEKEAKYSTGRSRAWAWAVVRGSGGVGVCGNDVKRTVPWKQSAASKNSGELDGIKPRDLGGIDVYSAWPRRRPSQVDEKKYLD